MSVVEEQGMYKQETRIWATLPNSYSSIPLYRYNNNKT
jgi:hypothetical protein